MNVSFEGASMEGINFLIIREENFLGLRTFSFWHDYLVDVGVSAGALQLQEVF